ncbi:MAG: DNA polymerase Y family protein [Casimicrobiaceae bacterium]
MLWVCLLLPALPLEVFLRAHEAHAALRFAVTSGGHSPRIVAANDAAADAGIAPGQLVSAALALAPDVRLRERDLAAEHDALATVATALGHFTPTVCLAPPQALVAEIGGSVRLFGGLRSLLAAIRATCTTLGYAVQAACAPTPTAARLLARAGVCRAILDQDALDAALAPLALVHLEADPAALALLRSAGVTTFGAACALPREALARRVGASFVERLDHARGRSADPQVPFVPAARFRGRLVLPVPVGDVEALGFALNRLVHELATWLLGRGLGVSTLNLDLEHERYVATRTGTVATTVPFALASPARDATHLLAVLRERLGRVVLPAPVESMELSSAITAPLAGRNLGLLPGDDATPMVPLLDRLRARLGEDAVVRVTPRADHRPERAWHEDPPVTTSLPNARPSRRTPAPSAMPVSPPLPAAPRPLWVLREPQPLAATFEDKPWILRDGPERIESGWWDGADIRRDYYIAESPRGERLWIYRDSLYGDAAEWFLQGIFA